MDMEDDMMYSNFMALSSGANYIRNIKEDKIMIRNQEVLLFLENLGKDAPGAKALGITNRDDSSPHISFQEDILLMIQTTDAFCENDDEPELFDAHSFVDTPGLFLMSFLFATCSKRKRHIRALRVFLMGRFSKPK